VWFSKAFIAAGRSIDHGALVARLKATMITANASPGSVPLAFAVIVGTAKSW
jgi:hypothetical protein